MDDETWPADAEPPEDWPAVDEPELTAFERWQIERERRSQSMVEAMAKWGQGPGR